MNIISVFFSQNQWSRFVRVLFVRMPIPARRKSLSTAGVMHFMDRRSSYGFKFNRWVHWPPRYIQDEMDYSYKRDYPLGGKKEREVNERSRSSPSPRR